MDQDRAIDLYLTLTDAIHNYWLGFGAVTVLFIGWLLYKPTPLLPMHRIGLTIGWFGATGYLGSSLMNRYNLLAALSRDIVKMVNKSEFLQSISELGPIYQHYETIVWSSFGFISVGAMILIWTNIASK
ncbi:MAG: hypothetical protein OQL16_06260 [Gammaproteobacteria bacterium]|nr:hypothetical protein [Gammaproteobacteria bacterium]